MSTDRLFSQSGWHEAMRKAGDSRFDVDAQRALDGELGQYWPKEGRIWLIKGKVFKIAQDNPDIHEERAV